MIQLCTHAYMDNLPNQKVLATHVLYIVCTHKREMSNVPLGLINFGDVLVAGRVICDENKQIMYYFFGMCAD